MKYNYNKIEFEICGHNGNKDELSKHLIKCGLIKYHCLFCDEDILQMNLKHHVEKVCKFRIIKFKEYKFLGEMNYNLKEGYGVEFYIMVKNLKVNLKME